MSSVNICRLNVVHRRWSCWTMVAVGNCSWKGYLSSMLSYILLIGILWCRCGFILGDGSWGFHHGSDITSMRGLFFWVFWEFSLFGGGRSVRYIVYIWNIFSLCHSNASSDGYNFRILGSKTVSPLKSVKNSESSIKGDISIL